MKRLSTLAVAATIAASGLAAVVQSTVLGDVPAIDAHAAAVAPWAADAMPALPAGGAR